MLKFLYVTFVLCLLTPLSFASEGAGSSGGGNAVVCFDSVELAAQVLERKGEITDADLPHITSIVSYDLYEAREVRHYNVIALKEGETDIEYVNRILARFEKIYLSLANALKASQAAFDAKGRTLWQANGVFRMTDGKEIGRMGDHCVLSTIAVQVQRESISELHIDERLYNHEKHDILSRAFLRLHEIVYRYARVKHLHVESSNSRVLVGLMTRADEMTLAEVFYELSNLSMDIPESYSDRSYPFTSIDKMETDLIRIANTVFVPFDEKYKEILEPLFEKVNQFIDEANKEYKAHGTFAYSPNGSIEDRFNACSSVSWCYGAMNDVIHYGHKKFGKRAKVFRAKFKKYLLKRAEDVNKAVLNGYVEKKIGEELLALSYLSAETKLKLEEYIRTTLLPLFGKYSINLPASQTLGGVGFINNAEKAGLISAEHVVLTGDDEPVQ